MIAPRSQNLIRLAGVLAPLVLSAAVAARADDPRRNAAPTRAPASAPAATPDADREAAALAFVRTHHPELATLLESLKPMRPTEYEKAIRQIAQVNRSLQAVAVNDPQRYELGLDAWKARSRVELLTARLASRGEPSAANRDLESQLRQAVAAQLEVEIRLQRYERDQAQARLDRLSQNLRRLEANPSVIAESRYQALLKKSQRASGRIQLGGASAKSAAPGKTRSKAAADPAVAGSRSRAATAPVNASATPNPGRAPVEARSRSQSTSTSTSSRPRDGATPVDTRTPTPSSGNPSEGERPR